MQAQAELFAHPASAATHGWRLTTQLQRNNQHLELQYQLEGDLDQLKLPAVSGGRRRDDLWQHSCFEAFVQSPGQGGYIEYNLAPNGDWAEYHFSAYRQALPLAQASAPAIRLHKQDQQLRVTARLLLPDNQLCKIGLSAVLEDRSGQLSYWALTHPGPQPDFHDAAGFVLTLE